MGKRLPFRTTSNHQALGRLRGRSKIPGRKTLPFDFDTDFDTDFDFDTDPDFDSVLSTSADSRSTGRVEEEDRGQRSRIAVTASVAA
ncbi:MAG: hypothetical protein ACOX52_08780 [Verrucomicrobiota bacterium]